MKKLIIIMFIFILTFNIFCLREDFERAENKYVNTLGAKKIKKYKKCKTKMLPMIKLKCCSKLECYDDWMTNQCIYKWLENLCLNESE